MAPSFHLPHWILFSSLLHFIFLMFHPVVRAEPDFDDDNFLVDKDGLWVDKEIPKGAIAGLVFSIGIILLLCYGCCRLCHSCCCPATIINTTYLPASPLPMTSVNVNNV